MPETLSYNPQWAPNTPKMVPFGSDCHNDMYDIAEQLMRGEITLEEAQARGRERLALLDEEKGIAPASVDVVDDAGTASMGDMDEYRKREQQGSLTKKQDRQYRFKEGYMTDRWDKDQHFPDNDYVKDSSKKTVDDYDALSHYASKTSVGTGSSEIDYSDYEAMAREALDKVEAKVTIPLPSIGVLPRLLIPRVGDAVDTTSSKEISPKVDTPKESSENKEMSRDEIIEKMRSILNKALNREKIFFESHGVKISDREAIVAAAVFSRIMKRSIDQKIKDLVRLESIDVDVTEYENDINLCLRFLSEPEYSGEISVIDNTLAKIINGLEPRVNKRITDLESKQLPVSEVKVDQENLPAEHEFIGKVMQTDQPALFYFADRVPVRLMSRDKGDSYTGYALDPFMVNGIRVEIEHPFAADQNTLKQLYQDAAHMVGIMPLRIEDRNGLQVMLCDVIKYRDAGSLHARYWRGENRDRIQYYDERALEEAASASQSESTINAEQSVQQKKLPKTEKVTLKSEQELDREIETQRIKTEYQSRLDDIKRAQDAHNRGEIALNLDGLSEREQKRRLYIAGRIHRILKNGGVDDHIAWDASNKNVNETWVGESGILFSDVNDGSKLPSKAARMHDIDQKIISHFTEDGNWKLLVGEAERTAVGKKLEQLKSDAQVMLDDQAYNDLPKDDTHKIIYGIRLEDGQEIRNLNIPDEVKVLVDRVASGKRQSDFDELKTLVSNLQVHEVAAGQKSDDVIEPVKEVDEPSTTIAEPEVVEESPVTEETESTIESEPRRDTESDSVTAEVETITAPIVAEAPAAQEPVVKAEQSAVPQPPRDEAIDLAPRVADKVSNTNTQAQSKVSAPKPIVFHGDEL